MVYSPYFLTLTILVLSLEQSSLAFKIPFVGSSFRDINPKIVNGHITTVKRFPYQVSIFTITAHPKPNLERGN